MGKKTVPSKKTLRKRPYGNVADPTALIELNETVLSGFAKVLLDSVNEVLAVIDEKGVLLYSNEAGAYPLGKVAKDIIGQRLRDLFLPDDAERLLGLVRETIRTGRGRVEELSVRVFHGLRWYRLRVEPLSLSEGTPVAALLLGFDITDRKRFEEEAHFYQALVENANYGVGTIDNNGFLIQLNRTFAVLHGYTPEELMGAHVSLLHTEDQMLGVRQILEHVRSTREPFLSEVWHRRRGGSVFPALMSVSPILNADGEVVAISGTVIDITEQKNIEAALRTSEERFRMLWKHIPVPTYIWRRIGDDFLLSSYNDAGVAITRGGIKKLVGIPLNKLYADRPDIVEDVNRCYVEKEDFARRMPYVLRSTGEHKYMDIHYVYVPPDSVMLHTVDITDLILAQEELKRSEKRYSTLVENAPYGIAVIDAQTGKFVDANRVVEEMFGMPRSVLLEYGPLDVSPLRQPDGKSSEELARTHVRSALSGKTVRFEWVHCRQNGESFYAEVLMQRLPDPDSKRVRVTIVDITEKKKHEEIIVQHQMAMIAASRLSALGTMASYITHEINNPLATISAAAEQMEDFLRAGVLDHEHVLRLASHIRRHAGRIERIMKGLRVLSREGLSEPFTPVNLRTIILDTLELCMARFRAYGVELRFNDSGESVEVEGRETQISQVLVNLLNNAFDATVGREHAWVEIELRDLSGWAEIAVTDNGVGISEEYVNRIFDAYFSTKDASKGTGLGLSISKTLVLHHGGELFLDRDHDYTRFVVRLPKRQKKKAKKEGT